MPLNPTGRYFGVSGNAGTGMRANFNKHNSIEGDFMWSGLSPSLSLVRPIDRPTGSVNLYAVTENYRFHIDSLAGSAFGVYVTGGGGWYYPYHHQQELHRATSYGLSAHLQLVGIRLRQQRIHAIGDHSLSRHKRGGLDAGVGFTIKLPSPGWKFFIESRYNYAWSSFVPTALVPVTFGFRFN